MPIRDIQRRHAELGRIRLGYKADTQRGGTRPAKLERFRFTSPSETYIRDLAQLYGGDATAWDNNGKPEWEVFTQAASIPVIAVKGGLSQWMETWSGGGCIHRCDGEFLVDGTPCDQDPTTIRIKRDGQYLEVPAHDEAKPTTRLSVMLPQLEAIGVWRLESHGWNAAAELPTVAELAQFVGTLVPAELHLVERRTIKNGETSRFVVPVLDLRIGAHRLQEIAAAVAGGMELEAAAGTTSLAIEASATTATTPAQAEPVDNEADFLPWREQVIDADNLNDLGDIWRRMVAEQLVGPEARNTPSAAEFVAFYKDRARTIQDAPPPPAEDGIVDAELVDEQQPATAPAAEDPDVVWQTVLARAGQLGMTTADLEDNFSELMGGLTSAEATAGEMRAYLTKLEGDQS